MRSTKAILADWRRLEGSWQLNDLPVKATSVTDSQFESNWPKQMTPDEYRRVLSGAVCTLLEHKDAPLVSRRANTGLPAATKIQKLVFESSGTHDIEITIVKVAGREARRANQTDLQHTIDRHRLRRKVTAGE